MKRQSAYWFVAIALGGAVVWAFWTTLGDMAERWTNDPQYSHGYLVPIFSVFLLWYRRSWIQGVELSPSWWGVAILLAGMGLLAAGTYLFFPWFSSLSLLFFLAGLAVVVGGWPTLRWSWQAIVFLGFMLPLPFRIQIALGGGLQRVATIISTYALQTLDAPAISEGNLILINNVKIGIVEACSGLGMLVTFFALSTAFAMLMKSSDWWLRACVVVSAVPVAIIANVTRITATGLLFTAARDDLARLVFHDIAGWLMMPVALGILFFEVHVLRRVVIDVPR